MLVPASIASLFPSVNAQVGAVVTSVLDVNTRVTVSPSLTSRPPALSDSVTPESVGCVLSIVTDPDPEETSTPALPFASPKLIV